MRLAGGEFAWQPGAFLKRRQLDSKPSRMLSGIVVAQTSITSFDWIRLCSTCQSQLAGIELDSHSW